MSHIGDEKNGREKLMIKVEKDTASGVNIITFAGSLDAYTVFDAEEIIEKLLQKKEYKIVVDLKDLTYISSVGIGVFIGHFRDIFDHGGNIIFISLSPQVTKIFSFLGITKLIGVAGSRKEALAKFN